jgi:hypothetical protein
MNKCPTCNGTGKFHTRSVGGAAESIGNCPTCNGIEITDFPMYSCEYCGTSDPDNHGELCDTCKPADDVVRVEGDCIVVGNIAMDMENPKRAEKLADAIRRAIEDARDGGYGRALLEDRSHYCQSCFIEPCVCEPQRARVVDECEVWIGDTQIAFGMGKNEAGEVCDTINRAISDVSQARRAAIDECIALAEKMVMESPSDGRGMLIVAEALRDAHSRSDQDGPARNEHDGNDGPGKENGD